MIWEESYLQPTKYFSHLSHSVISNLYNSSSMPRHTSTAGPLSMGRSGCWTVAFWVLIVISPLGSLIELGHDLSQAPKHKYNTIDSSTTSLEPIGYWTNNIQLDYIHLVSSILRIVASYHHYLPKPCLFTPLRQPPRCPSMSPSTIRPTPISWCRVPSITVSLIYTMNIGMYTSRLVF